MKWERRGGINIFFYKISSLMRIQSPLLTIEEIIAPESSCSGFSGHSPRNDSGGQILI